MTIIDLSSVTRRELVVRASDITTLLEWVCDGRPAGTVNASLRAGAERQIEQARRLAEGRSTVGRTLSGIDIETANRYLDAAYVNILRLAPPEYVDSLLTNLYIDAQQHLPPDDPRLEQLKDLQARASMGREASQLRDRDRYVVVATLQAVQSAANHEEGRVRNLRTVIIGVALVTFFLVVGIGAFGVWRPGALPMCFAPTDAQLIVCPFADQDASLPQDGAVVAKLRTAASAGDASLVLGVGLLGAAISAAAGLRRMNASHDPYSLQVTLAVAKLPIGALTAFLGILLLRAEFVPGLSALNSSAQIIGWAIVLGYAQQLFTGFVDKQATALLAQAASAPEPARAPSTPPGRRPTPTVATA